MKLLLGALLLLCISLGSVSVSGLATRSTFRRSAVFQNQHNNLPPQPSNGVMASSGTKRNLGRLPMRLNIFPQIVFAASCAFGVFWYVFNNIEEIKEKQGKAIAQTMAEQSKTLKSTQELQRANIDKAMREQAENIARGQREAEERRKKL